MIEKAEIENFDYISPFHIPCWNPKSYLDLPSPPKPDGIQISVCVSTWARSKHIITTSIESILKQSFPPENFEVILSDDATEGSRRDELMKAVKYLIREYPNHNFRAYFIKRSRSWNDTHTLNVAFKRVLGWITVQNQTDVFFLDKEILESAWRHHNHNKKLRVFPHVMDILKDGTLQPSWVGTAPGDPARANGKKPKINQPEPHELGASYPTACVHKVKGRDERILVFPPDEVFQWNMRFACGLVAIKDPSVKVANRGFDIPSYFATPRGPKESSREPTEEIRQKVRELELKIPWTNENNWGLLTPEEEKLTLMTEAMKKNLGKW